MSASGISQSPSALAASRCAIWSLLMPASRSAMAAAASARAFSSAIFSYFTRSSSMATSDRRMGSDRREEWSSQTGE